MFESMPLDAIYNMSRFATGGSHAKGHHLSEEHRRKIGAANKGKVYSEEYRKWMSEDDPRTPEEDGGWDAGVSGSS